MKTVKRNHPLDTSDSEAVPCPKCNGSGKNRFGNFCGSANEDQGGCQGSGTILQQRRDSQTGYPERVVVEG